MTFKDGVWSIFIPNLNEYEIYKFEIEDKFGNKKLKSVSWLDARNCDPVYENTDVERK